MKKQIFSLMALVLILLLTVQSVHAKSYPTDSFEHWLEKYGAWDRLEKEYAQGTENETPESILKRAQVYLNLNSPGKALEIVEMTPAFADNATEFQRLWYGGQAHRALGDISKAVLWFSQASEHVDNTADLNKLFKGEPALESIWKDVWLKLYWAYGANHTLSRSNQAAALNRISAIGASVWGGKYWDKAKAALKQTTLPVMQKQPITQPVGAGGLPIPPFISKEDNLTIVKALASVSLEKFDEAQALIDTINQQAVRFFWASIIDFLKTGHPPQTLTPLIDGNYLKATAFWQGNIMAPYSTSHSAWVLGNPDSGPWLKFRDNLLSMPVQEANKAIDKELGSMLISEQTASLLNSFKLALSMSNGNFIDSATTWNTVNKQKLPLGLQLAGVIFFKDDFNAILPDDTAKAFAIYPIIAALYGAAGNDLRTPDEANFWIAAPQDKLTNLVAEYPMDKLLLLAHWQQQFDTRPTEALAKRSAFLFDDTSFGTEALLYLANQSVKAKKLQLGAYYLNKVDANALHPKHKMAWLDTKVRLELDSGRSDAALKTFHEMDQIGLEIPAMTRLRMALLYQQNRDFVSARKQLLNMWKNRAQMPTALQAETLFWLGEGEQGLRNTEKALGYYLQLAWQYPQENIWALTAMYRASLIYEKRGKYDTAKRLLTTVVKRADRKEQREAAQSRIAAIEKKMGKPKNNTNSVLVYPF